MCGDSLVCCSQTQTQRGGGAVKYGAPLEDKEELRGTLEERADIWQNASVFCVEVSGQFDIDGGQRAIIPIFVIRSEQ